MFLVGTLRSGSPFPRHTSPSRRPSSPMDPEDRRPGRLSRRRAPMVTRLLGRKLGMSQVYNEKGQCFPVTVLEAGPCVVTQVKTKDNDGYAAVQIAFGERRPKNVSRAELGHIIP